ncbi:hypothetical protein IV203_022057 [Nitzschia inconspicua]|uniref:Uncharacterized protein n=1 Tax=Nitzschia inconspicua TaxID=303405 RepID=A0A9K3KJC1_9STRA|nr:hypothetical protein IV203_022057 [Nitzschia inconspicua]
MHLSLHGSRQKPFTSEGFEWYDKELSKSSRPYCHRSLSLNGMTKNYLPYKKAGDLIVTDPCTPADHVLINISIKTIISAMWEGPDYTNFYNNICEKRHHASSLVTKMEDTLTWRCCRIWIPKRYYPPYQ